MTEPKRDDRYKEALEAILDEQFPKGGCDERGAALVLFAYACMLHDGIEIKRKDV